MSKGAGRLERAILATAPYLIPANITGVSTNAICRAVYPGVPIEKKHRVAVLQVLHRIMNNPPRVWEHRQWTIQKARKRGYWRRVPLLSLHGCDDLVSLDDWATAYHEAGHALAWLYFGGSLEQVAILTTRQRAHGRGFGLKGRSLRGGLAGVVRSRSAPTIDSPILDLITYLAGPIAEAHFCGKYPAIVRGISRTYTRYLVGSDRMQIDATVALFEPSIHAKLLRDTHALAQALIRSPSGWRFLRLLAAKLIRLKLGSLSHGSVVAVFRQAFGRPPPEPGTWKKHWPPALLPRVRVGWLPPP